MPSRANLPGRGDTFYGTTSTVPSTYTQSVEHEGVLKLFPNTLSTAKTVRIDGQEVQAIFVRNSSGITLIPGLTVSWASGYRGRRVNGYTDSTAEEVAGVVDPFLSLTSGVRNGDMFWLIIGGPCEVRTPKAADATNVWSEGDILYAQTAANSTAVTTGATTQDESGRLIPWTSLTSITNDNTDGTQSRRILNSVARVMSAATTANTNTLKLVDLMLRKPCAA